MNEEKFLKLLADLVAFRSTNYRLEEVEKTVDYVSEFFKDTNLIVEKHVFEGVASVVIRKESKSPKIFLVGHLDVVDGEDEQFSLTKEGDKLLGRGVFDMKGVDVVMMMLMKELAESEDDIALMLVGDEEVGGFNGTKKLLFEAGYKAEIAIIPDSGLGLSQIVAGEKGKLGIKFIAKGKSVHASRNWQGENAIMLLVETLQKVNKLFIPAEEHPEDHWVATFCPGEIKGGVIHNKVPDEAYVKCDIRYTEKETEEALLKSIEAVLPEGVSYECFFMEAPAHSLSLDSPYLKSYAEITEKVLGEKVSFHRTHGASDARHFAAKGTAVIMSQADGGNAHGLGEWVSLNSLKDFYRVLKEFLRQNA